MEKRAARHAKVFRKAAAYAGLADPDACASSLGRRLEAMYASDLFRRHDRYPTIDVEHVYAVIAMCLELREHGLSDSQILDALEIAYADRRRVFTVLLGAIDQLPFSYAIVRLWNVNDHEKRVMDGSIDYDTFEVRDHSVEYRISGCRYVDMFDAWGVRALCKVFCETDTRSYASLTRHVEFVRHSDLSDGPSCHDEILERGWRDDRSQPRSKPSQSGRYVMKEQADYKNWIPKGMVWGMAAGTAALAVGCAAAWRMGSRLGVGTRIALRAGTSVGLAACGAFTVWCAVARRRFSYEGKKQLSRIIVEGTAEHVVVPEGGTCLDVGCGSGALAIAVAKRNPGAQVVGCDLWGPEYASFSQGLCEANAAAEGVTNASFEPGDARQLPFADGSFDAVTSNYVYHNIVGTNKQDLLRETLRCLRKGGTFAIHDLMGPSRYGDMRAFAQSLRNAGYERVELIPTDDGLFMGKTEATLMMLTGSTLLVGVK